MERLGAVDWPTRRGEDFCWNAYSYNKICRKYVIV